MNEPEKMREAAGGADPGAAAGDTGE